MKPRPRHVRTPSYAYVHMWIPTCVAPPTKVVVTRLQAKVAPKAHAFPLRLRLSLWLAAKTAQKFQQITLDALRTRQSLVKGERLVRHEMRAVLPLGHPGAISHEVFGMHIWNAATERSIKASSTRRASQAVPHPSTDRAFHRLASGFE